MKIVRFSYAPLTTTSSSPAGNNGYSFQTVLEHTSFVGGSWLSDRESVNCGATEFRRRNPGRKYKVEYSDGSYDFVSKSVFNALREAAGIDLVG